MSILACYLAYYCDLYTPYIYSFSTATSFLLKIQIRNSYLALREHCHSEHERIWVPLQRELKGEGNFVRSPRVGQERTCLRIHWKRDGLFGGQRTGPSSMKKYVSWLGQARSPKGSESHGQSEDLLSAQRNGQPVPQWLEPGHSERSPCDFPAGAGQEWKWKINVRDVGSPSGKTWHT